MEVGGPETDARPSVHNTMMGWDVTKMSLEGIKSVAFWDTRGVERSCSGRD